MELDSVSRLDLPYKNLVLTGFLGVGKTTIGRHLSQRLSVELFDIDEEIELRELMSVAKIREVYGESRLRALEHELCRQAALMRQAVVVVPGAAMIDPRNYTVLTDSGQIVCLTCELGEALRRLHLASEQQYRDKDIRHRMLGRLRRERKIIDDARLLQLDTTHLSIEEELDLLVEFWIKGKPESALFHYGPKPPITPPVRARIGLSRPSQGNSEAAK